MKPRKLVLPNGIYRYIIRDDGTVSLWSPSGKPYQINAQHVFTTCMCSCLPEYQCFGKGFSPGALRRFIEAHNI